MLMVSRLLRRQNRRSEVHGVTWIYNGLFSLQPQLLCVVIHLAVRFVLLLYFRNITMESMLFVLLQFFILLLRKTGFWPLSDSDLCFPLSG